MNKKTRGSEKVLFSCEKNGKRSLAEFENVEEALKASGGMGINLPSFSQVPVWWRFGQPDPTILQNIGRLTNLRNFNKVSRG